VIAVLNWIDYQHQGQSGGQSEGIHNKVLEQEYKKKKKNVQKAENKFDLEAAYQLYPRKQGKKKGILKLEKIIKTEQDYNLLLVGIKNYSREKEGIEKKYIKLFSSFVESEAWLDEDIQDFKTDEQKVEQDLLNILSGRN